MQASSRLFTFTLTLLTALLLSACNPIRPVAQDGAGRELPLLNEVLDRVEQVAQPESFDTPWDATPDPDGEFIYFTATAGDSAGVFRVPAAGGDVIEVMTGAPFMTPLGLAISSDGQHLYVADAEAMSDSGAGQIFVLSVERGALTALAGSAGTAPRGVEIKNEDGADVLYFSGNDAVDGQPAVWKIAVQGGEPTQIAKGAPLVEPVGVAITNEGVVYVADRAASGDGLGSVFRITDGTIETIADGFRTGTPVVGATLTLDESVLLVSALAPNRDSAQVLLINLATLDKGIINKVIAANAGSGGVHRAHNVNLFAWSDSTGGRGRGQGREGQNRGGVYALEPAGG